MNASSIASCIGGRSKHRLLGVCFHYYSSRLVGSSFLALRLLTRIKYTEVIVLQAFVVIVALSDFASDISMAESCSARARENDDTQVVLTQIFDSAM